MKNPTFDELFGSLKKYGLGYSDKCSANKDKEHNCEWAKVGTLEYCKLHKGIRIKSL